DPEHDAGRVRAGGRAGARGVRGRDPGPPVRACAHRRRHFEPPDMTRHAFARVPGATYRLQLHAGFGFRAAREALPYLRALGVTDVYLSPVFQARRGGTARYA